MKCLFLMLTSCFILSCSTQDKERETQERIEEVEIPYGEPIPFLLGVHNEHDNRDSLKIEFIDNSGLTFLIHKGELQGWGMRWTNKKINTGEYRLRLTWEEESGLKKTERKILIKPETKYFSLNIELANEPLKKREHNAIYLDQYTKSLEDVEFVRKWEPMEQFESDTLFIPDYNVTNKNDSTLYGAYTRFSSSLSINWVQPHSIAFMEFEVKTDSGWVDMSCNAPRIEMDLKSNEQGRTLKDITLGCAKENFESNRTYRVVINYMLNDRIFEKNKKQKEMEDNVYVEQTIYSYEDEFKL